jgi:hypothetical protein
MTEYDDWDDDRLTAAFHTRFDRSAPVTVARAVHAAIAGTTPTRFHAFERLQARHLATAAVVIVLVGALTVALADIGRLGGGPSTPAGSGGVATAGVSATPTAQAITGEAFSLPVIQVTDAIAVRDAGVDDRELAVMGWFTPPRLVSCGPAPTADPVSPLESVCPDELTWLTENWESLVHVRGNRTDGSGPQGPALNPDLDELDSSWWPDLPIAGVDGDSAPIDVVFVGHFDDRRAELCPEAEVEACRDRFVVDAVATVAGMPQSRSVVRQTGMVAGSTESDIEAIVANEAPQSPILSMVVTDGAEGLVRIEPSLAYGQQGLTGRPVVWVVRVLESERVVTYIVVDGTDAIYELGQEGDATHVGGTTGDPVVTPGPWPPDSAVIVPLTSAVGAGKPPVEVAVVDESGRLTGATEKGTVDPFDAPIGTSGSLFDAYAEPAKPGRVHLTWIGGICDGHITVTVAADLSTITFDMGPQPDCDSIGVGRELVLDFERSVDVPSIELRDAADNPKGSPAYNLDCGPLGPDTCQKKASAVIAANEKRSPTNRVVSIAFSDECGSYTVLFDDGTARGADIDCILP